MRSNDFYDAGPVVVGVVKVTCFFVATTEGIYVRYGRLGAGVQEITAAQYGCIEDNVNILSKN